MCQLLGMNGNVPTACFSFDGFRQRGGVTDHHKDGWGIAFFEGPGCRVFLDVEPSATSPVAELVRQYPIRSRTVIAHIRKATQGRIALENTHPFQRELWGRYWIFAHNGNLKDFSPTLDGSFLPVGDTDSELAFCAILQALRAEFGDSMPLRKPMFSFLTAITREIGARGEFNFLLSNGNCLYAHCATHLAYIVRQAPFPVAHLKDQDVSIDLEATANPDDRVAVIATQPLTDNETWTVVEPGTLLLFHDGRPLFAANTA